RDAAYSLLTEDDSKLGHRLAAAYLAGVGEHDPMVIAEHHRHGGELERAVPWYVRAADQAMATHDLKSVLTRAERGIACGARERALGDLSGLQCAAHFWRDEWGLGYPVGTEALSLLEAGSLRWCKTIAHLFIFTSVGVRNEAHFGELVSLFGS